MLLSALASRGAHIIAISPYPLEHAVPSLLIPLLRSTTNNENIFAEYADLSNSASIREFCTRFLTGQDQRLDAIVFAHEYRIIGSLVGGSDAKNLAEKRETASLATFLMLTLLLPALLVEPAERDIRIVNVVNPFYAASAPLFTNQLTLAGSSSSSSPLLLEGSRALRTTVLTRHLQRVLDSLPNHATDAPPNTAAEPEAHSKRPEPPHPSNIISISVCPGISRKDTIAPLLRAQRDSEESVSILGFAIYVLLFPFFLLFTKSPNSALQSVLHVLFLPTPLKRALAHVDEAANPSAASRPAESEKPTQPRIVNEEVLKPGALYRECAVVQLNVPPLAASELPPQAEKEQQKRKGKQTETQEEADLNLPDDGEYGGEAVGRAVWEWYEENLKKWEAQSQTQTKEQAGDDDTAK